MGASGQARGPPLFGGGAVIFLTIGTHEPFERLIRAIDEWCGTTPNPPKVFGQITDEGMAHHRPKNFEAVARMTPKDYNLKFHQSDLIISHAGMGSILTALSRGKPIVVMPRRGHLRETRNDHQFTTAKHLGDRPNIFVAKDETELPALLDRTLETLGQHKQAPVSQDAPPQFTAALREYLMTNTFAPNGIAHGQNGKKSFET